MWRPPVKNWWPPDNNFGNNWWPPDNNSRPPVMMWMTPANNSRPPVIIWWPRCDTTTTITMCVYPGVPGHSPTSSVGATLWRIFQFFRLQLLFLGQFLLVLGGFPWLSHIFLQLSCCLCGWMGRKLVHALRFLFGMLCMLDFCRHFCSYLFTCSILVRALNIVLAWVLPRRSMYDLGSWDPCWDPCFGAFYEVVYFGLVLSISFHGSFEGSCDLFVDIFSGGVLAFFFLGGGGVFVSDVIFFFCLSEELFPSSRYCIFCKFILSWVPFFFILSPIIILYLSVIVSMSSGPDSIYSASLGVNSGTISILLMMRSSSWLSFLFSSFVGFLVSPAYVIMGIMQADTSF